MAVKDEAMLTRVNVMAAIRATTESCMARALHLSEGE